MKSNSHIRIKVPLLSWLFLLFLSTGSSAFQDHFRLAERQNRIEQIASSTPVPDTKPGKFIHYFSGSKHNDIPNGYSGNIRFISQKHSALATVKMAQPLTPRSIIFQNIVLHFRSRNLSPEHAPAFIS